MRRPFSLAIACRPSAIRREAREISGDMVIGFALNSSPASSKYQIIQSSMIGRTREQVTKQHILAMLDSLARSDYVDADAVFEAARDWARADRT